MTVSPQPRSYWYIFFQADSIHAYRQAWRDNVRDSVSMQNDRSAGVVLEMASQCPSYASSLHRGRVGERRLEKPPLHSRRTIIAGSGVGPWAKSYPDERASLLGPPRAVASVQL